MSTGTTSAAPGPRSISAGSTNQVESSLVKVVVSESQGRWLTPKANEEFYIDSDATFPAIVFEFTCEEQGPYEWSWEIQWEAKRRTRETGSRGTKQKTFSEKGRFSSAERKWEADFDGKVLGGKLTVEVAVGSKKFVRSAIIKAKNPTREAVIELLGTIDDVVGFEAIIEKESGFRNFINADGEPLLSFDGGYGLTQMTTPAPTYAQVWNWKENVRGGTGLYKTKQVAAKTYLGSSKRTYTADQLKLETLSRWNGGSYHTWNATAKQWERKQNIKCDTGTGNIGWDMDNAANTGMTEAQLHERDKGTYKDPKKDKTDENKWIYTGVCYADHL